MELIDSIIRAIKNPIKRLSKDNSVYTDKYSLEASDVVTRFDFTKDDLRASKASREKSEFFYEIKSIAWFIPGFDNPYWGGIHTILRFADYLKSEKNVQSRFVIIGDAQKDKISESIGMAFPAIKDDVLVLNSEQEMHKIGEVDATISTLWTTAYHSLRFNNTSRKFYFIQDYEPLFYPAGSESALVDATYQFGFYGIANTITLKEIYNTKYGGAAEYFNPCIDKEIFFPNLKKAIKEPYTVFFYGRPGHPRNGFELGIAALKKLKSKMGEKVKIITAGSKWKPSDFDLEGIIENLGLLSYKETADLYRRCDLGLVMMFTRHPSYIPFELMACGCFVVTNFNPANTWLLQDRINCLLSPASASCLCETIEEGLKDAELHQKIIQNALTTISKYGNWNAEIEKIYAYMCDPNRRGQIENKSPSRTFSFRGYDIPIQLLNMTGGGVDTFESISDAHIKNIGAACGLESDMRIMEIGCGIGRDAIPLTQILSSDGNYIGIDIIKDSIDWCKNSITAKHANFKFFHYDVKDQLHNPKGNISTQDIKLPADDKSVDLIILQSVFTHMFEQDIIHYLKEFNRILTNSGKVYATFFVVDEKILQTARKTNLTIFNLRFDHYIGNGCYINNKDFPTGAVAYDREAIRRMMIKGNLRQEGDIRHGSWSGYYKDAFDGQDVVVLKK